MCIPLLPLLTLALAQEPVLPMSVPDLDALHGRIGQIAAKETASGFVYGTSRAGHALHGIELSRGPSEDARPALLVVAGLTQGQAWTASLALDLAENLLGSELLDHARVLVVPLANPDAYAARFAQPLQEHPATGPGVDNDRDGREGEDPPADVNGDGFITWMRVPDPEGTWLVDQAEPRLHQEADPLERQRGRWKLVREGFDADGDGEASEDGPSDVEVNRNFPALWEEHAPRAGRYPADEPATRALAMLVAGRKDLQAVLVIGEQDNLVRKPSAVADDAPASMRVPKVGLRQSDADRLEQLAKRWKETTGLESADAAETDDAGTFAHWAYAHRGLLTLSTRPWNVPQIEAGGETEGEGDKTDAQDPEPEAAPELSDEAKRLHWLESNGRPNAHLGWTSFEHPQLGPVEIGGYRPFVQDDPSAGLVDGLGQRMGEFLQLLGPDLARIAFSEASATDLGGGLLDVRVALVNEGWLPLRSSWGQRTRTQRLPRVTLELPEGATLVAGRLQTIARDLDGGERQEFRWLVQGASPADLVASASTDHAGEARITFEDQQ